MNLASIFSFFPTLLSILGDLPKAVSALQGLDKLIKDAEATGQDGPTKLAAVLNDFEAMLNTINPAWGGDFAAIAAEVESVVNEVVGFYNGFAKAVKAI